MRSSYLSCWLLFATVLGGWVADTTQAQVRRSVHHTARASRPQPIGPVVAPGTDDAVLKALRVASRDPYPMPP